MINPDTYSGPDDDAGPDPDPDDYTDFGGAWDGFQVTSDADPGL